MNFQSPELAAMIYFINKKEDMKHFLPMKNMGVWKVFSELIKAQNRITTLTMECVSDSPWTLSSLTKLN